MLTQPAAFIESLGWLIALMLAALLPGLPAMRRSNHTGWIIAFCATRLLVSAGGLVGLAGTGATRELTAILSGTLLWEFARRTWNDTRPLRISGITHIVALECFALIFAANAGAGWTATLGWLLPVAVVVATLPVLLGGGAVVLLWRCFDRSAMRVSAIGFGLYGLGTAAGPVGAIGPVAPWLAAAGFAGVCFNVPAMRGRVAFAWIGGLLATFAVGPLVIAENLRGIATDQHAELLDRAQQAVAPLPGRSMAGLEAEGAPGVQARTVLREHLKNLRPSDALLREVSVWTLRGGRRLTLDLADDGNAAWMDSREAAPVETEQATGLRPFIVRAGARVIVHGPISAGPLETPVAWLALDYPEVFWAMQRDHVQRNGVVFMAVLAGFCAMGFVLTGRQAIENAQRLEIERVQAADKAKTEFLAFLGHELRTPLQTILGRAELLRAQPTAARHANAIEEQGRLLLRLVTDLLDLGTIEAGRFELRPQPFSLRALLTALEDETRAQADAAGLTLTCVVHDLVPDSLLGDDLRLRQILGNLLGNAVKYTTSGGVSLEIVREATESTDVFLAIRVRDTGPGLPPEKIPQLFTLFTRLDSGETFTREGTGVGLALVRRLCSLMGGTVVVANHPEGGAEFTVRLAFPLGSSGVAPRPASGPSSVLPSLAILLAEDHTATRELLTEALTAAGHHVVAVSDGDAALAVAEVNVFDAAVLDINLPRRDGIALARALRARYPAILVIGCSAEALPAMRETALAAGMNELLVKPVGLEMLIRSLGSKPRANSDSVFARLRSADSVGRVRTLLRAEWPRLSVAAEKSHSAGDRDAFKKCAHYLRSSALLLGDQPLLDLCGRLAAEDPPAGNNHPRVMLEELEAHFAKWSAEPNSPVTSEAPVRKFVT
ncbi:MAG: ATP-binding protein [Opitutaceae bacterium]